MKTERQRKTGAPTDHDYDLIIESAEGVPTPLPSEVSSEDVRRYVSNLLKAYLEYGHEEQDPAVSPA